MPRPYEGRCYHAPIPGGVVARNSKTGIVVGLIFAAIFAVGLGYLLLRDPQAGSVSPGKASVRATSRPATRPRVIPKKTVDVPFLVSPSEMGHAADRRIGGLIDAYNQRQDKISKLTLKGTCGWSFDGDAGTPRPMTVSYDRAADRATIACGPQQCVVEHAKVTMDADAVMNIDALYLLMFRKFDPEDLKLDTALSDETKIVAASAKEKLTFDAETGRVLAAEVTSSHGPVIVEFEGNLAVGELGIPAIVRVTPPVKMLPFAVKQPGGTVTFAIKEGKVE